jgi:hypothetical protein
MDPRLARIAEDPANQIFDVVFFPDRVYHQAYLNATRSSRYRYHVHEVRGYQELQCLKGQVFLDGAFLCHFLRIEYRGSRLTEVVRTKDRFLRNSCDAWIRLTDDSGRQAATDPQRLVTLHYDDWVNAFQAEIWSTLQTPATVRHDTAVLSMMGHGNQITRVSELDALMADETSIAKVEVAFREPSRYFPFGKAIGTDDLAWDNNFGRTHQAPIVNQPSATQNTVSDSNYLLDFQRGWYKQLGDVSPVEYRNAMMLGDANGRYTNPDAAADNIIQMRWLFQRELGGSMVFFHQVTIPPGKVEGNHQHVGSEELYFIIEGSGFAYLRVGDDPTLGDETNPKFPIVPREVFGLGMKNFFELPVEPGSMIFTKSGGMHGIRNPATSAGPLRFVAFLYHSS